MDGGAWWAAVHGVAESRTGLSDFTHAAAKLLQLCPTLSDPMDCSPPGSSIHWIFQARVLEWGAIAFSILSPTIYLFNISGFHPLGILDL